MADAPVKRELKIGDEVFIGGKRGHVVSAEAGPDGVSQIDPQELFTAAANAIPGRALLCRAAAFHKSIEYGKKTNGAEADCLSCGASPTIEAPHAPYCEWVALRDEYKRLGVWPECE